MPIFKSIIILGLVSYAIAQGYVWSHDTTISAETNKIVESGKAYLVNKKNETINSTKQAVKDGFDAGAEKIGIKTEKVESNKIPTENKGDLIKKDTDVIKKDTDVIKKDTVKENKMSLSWLYEIKFKYDDTGSSEKISKSQILSMIKNASDVWEKSCGVRFKMDGDIRSDYINADNDGTSRKNFGIVRWSEIEGDTLGTAHVGGKNGPVGDFIMNINTNLFSTNKDKISTESLQALITHEFGHVLGLEHSRLSNSVMHFQQKTFNKELNEGDTQMCRETVEQWDKNPTNKKFKL